MFSCLLVSYLMCEYMEYLEEAPRATARSSRLAIKSHQVHFIAEWCCPNKDRGIVALRQLRCLITHHIRILFI